MKTRVEHGAGWELRLGDWRDLELPRAEATIEDPPYGKRTHEGQKVASSKARRFQRKCGRPDLRSADSLSVTGDLGYEYLDAEGAMLVGTTACAQTSGWVLEMCSHDLIPAYETVMGAPKRLVFAPVSIVIPGMNVRLSGDGPSNWTVHLMVSRPVGMERRRLGTKPGSYIGHTDTERRTSKVKGSKPLTLMEAILRDYTLRDDLVMDRFCGSGTTGVAAIRLGRRFWGCERDPRSFEITLKRLRNARPQAEAFATDGIFGRPMELPGLEGE